MPLIAAAAVPYVAAGAAALAGTAGSAIAQGNLNKKNRNFASMQFAKETILDQAKWQQQNTYNEGMWEKQKAYNEGLWHMQNNYDSPAAQMERFRAAGLNPNLIYGQSNMGGTLDAAQNSPAAATPAGRANQPQGQAPQLDLASGIFAYMDFKTKQLQNDNLEAQNEAIKAQTARTLEDTNAIRSGIGLKEQLRQFREGMNPLGLDAQRLKNRLSEQQYEMKEKYYEMDSERMHQWLKHNKAQIGRMISQNMTDSKQRELMDTEITLNRMGIGKGSPWWIRAMGTQLSKSGLLQDMTPMDAPMTKPGIKLHKDPSPTNWGSFKFPWDK